MTRTRPGTALILGATGRFGSHMAETLWNAGWTIRRFDRSVDDLMQAAQGVDVIVNGWNPQYQDWQAQIPGQTRAVIAAARASGARIVLAGNIYVYGEGAGPELTADTPHLARNLLGRVRTEMEATYRASGLPFLILRSGDYLDTRRSNSWFDSHMTKHLQRGRFAYPGNPDIPHAWAYLPDVANIGRHLLERGDLPQYLDLSIPGYTLSGRDMAGALSDVLGRDIRLTRFSWLPVHLLAPVMPLLPHVLEMRYLWEMPHWLETGPLAHWAPDLMQTPLDKALAQSAPVTEFLATQGQPKQDRAGSPPPPVSPAKAT